MTDTPLQADARRALALMDLTSLNADDSDASIAALCAQADTPAGAPAALCVYPAFIAAAHRGLSERGLRQRVRIATVTNFPDGGDDIARAARETHDAVVAGADEVDVVFPYRALMAGNQTVGRDLVAACKATCGEATLKVILETGELATPSLIRQACELAIAGGADFLKTSTGKVPVNATLESAELLLEAIKRSGADIGFKAAGGVRSAQDAAAYLALAERIMGADWVTPAHFRFGASSLLGNLLETLGVEKAVEAPGSGTPGGY